MNTAASASFTFRSAANVAYAIPINKARTLVRQIEAGRSSATVHVGDTAFLGVSDHAGTTPATRTATGTRRPRAPIVAGVVTGSPAERLGLSAGDTITALDGHGVASPNEIVSQLLRKAPGKTI